MASKTFLVAIFLILILSKSSEAQQSPGAFLGQLTWPQAEEKLTTNPIVIIPFGAGAKQHGLHLPMNTDQLVMEFLVKKAIANHNVIVTPPILHGWFPAFREFPGTEVADHNIFTQYIFQIAQSMVRLGAKRIVFLNTGISKATGLPISIAAREIRSQTGVTTLVVSWDDLETAEINHLIQQKSGGHADEVETSIYLYFDADKVNMKLAKQDYRTQIKKPSSGYQPGKFSRSPKDIGYSETGSSGSPDFATAQKGKKILEVMSQNWLTILSEFSNCHSSE